MIKAFIHRLKQSEFIRNVATLATGTTFAQAVSILTAPVLYRIYSKVDYGTLGLYLAITGVIGVFSTMQYLQPILLEKEDDDAKQVMWLNRIINIVTTILVALLVFLFGDYLGQLLGNKHIMPWLYLAPISIFFSGQSQIFALWANRKKKYKILSFNAILTAFLVPLVSISTGLYNNGPLGLFLGIMVSQVVPPIVLLVTLTKYDDLGFKYFDWNNIKAKAIMHKSFPIYSLPSEFVNRLTNQLPVFMLSSYAGPAIVGVYNLSLRMLGLPIQLIGGAIGQVFQQKAAEDYNNTDSCRPIFLKTLKFLFILSILPAILVLIYGPDLFALIFGEEWREAGLYARFLIIMFSAKLIVSPLTYVIIIRKKIQISLYLDLINLLLVSVSFYFGLTYFNSSLIAVALFSGVMFTSYLASLFISYKNTIKA